MFFLSFRPEHNKHAVVKVWQYHRFRTNTCLAVGNFSNFFVAYLIIYLMIFEKMFIEANWRCRHILTSKTICLNFRHRSSKWTETAKANRTTKVGKDGSIWKDFNEKINCRKYDVIYPCKRRVFSWTTHWNHPTCSRYVTVFF